MTTRQQLSPGMGAILGKEGTTFRVWAPHAEKVSVLGTFNDFTPGKHPLEHEEDGYWATFVPGAKAGQEYRFHLVNGDKELSRIDPYAREVTNSVGNGVIHDPEFDWQGDDYKLPNHNELVIYEMHIGTFHQGNADGPGTFDTVSKRLEHLRRLGVNCIEVMPIAEFAGDYSWGYNPSHIFAVETAYGGPLAFKRFVKRCHELGIGVILDVVYNHMGPSDLDLWQFDGWTENDKGGIYFYNDDRSNTPWGDTRPDYGRPQVRNYLKDNALMWLEDYHVDGLRYDSTVYMRTVDGATQEIPEAWSLFQEINGEIRRRWPNRILIAEDLQDVDALTAPVENGGAGFHSQWCAHFVHPLREAAITPKDEHRSMADLAAAITQKFNDDVFQRVIYSESHDEVANGKQRVPSEISPDDPHGWYAKKRSSLAGAIVFVSPGIPMLFQGQEFLETGWFEDTVPLDWDLKDEFHSILKMYRDLIKLRINTPDLCGQHVHVYRVDDEKNVLGLQRQDLVVLINFNNAEYNEFRLGFPKAGEWKTLFHSDSTAYGFSTKELPRYQAEPVEWDKMPASAEVKLPPYTLVVLAPV
jgi:1,4-alpha-glucan branching enzyme